MYSSILIHILYILYFYFYNIIDISIFLIFLLFSKQCQHVFLLDYLKNRKDNVLLLGFTFYWETGNQWSSISIYIVSFQNVYASDDRILCSVYWSGWLLFFPVHQGLFHTERSLKLCSGKVERRVPWIYGDSRFCYERVVQSCGFWSIAEIRDITFHQSSSFFTVYHKSFTKIAPKMWNALLSFLVFSFLQSIFLILTNL